MTIGIYALWWEESSMIYIGQSQHIERRFKEHVNSLKSNKHTNYKVTAEYVKYGLPELIILEECTSNALNDREISWTEEYNSIIEGLNIIEAGKVGHGANSNNSKYKKVQLLLVFRALYSSIYFNYNIVASKFNVKANLVQDIFMGKSHLWLRDSYPFLYSKMINNRDLHYINYKSYKTIYGKAARVLDTKTNTEYTVENIREFAIKHNLNNAHLGSVIRQHRKSHKGFILILN